MNKEKLIAELRKDEGVRPKVYKDTQGIETIGVGRNLVDVGLSEDEIDYLLSNDIDRSIWDAKQLFSSFDSLSDTRQRVLTNMSFNLGMTRFGKFKKLIAAVESQDFHTASIEMLDSKWARQVGNRATRLSEMMRVG